MVAVILLRPVALCPGHPTHFQFIFGSFTLWRHGCCLGRYAYVCFLYSPWYLNWTCPSAVQGARLPLSSVIPVYGHALLFGGSSGHCSYKSPRQPGALISCLCTIHGLSMSNPTHQPLSLCWFASCQDRGIFKTFGLKHCHGPALPWTT